jgi:hypothetical protein
MGNKPEIRSTKFETSANDQKLNVQNPSRARFAACLYGWDGLTSIVLFNPALLLTSRSCRL